MAPVLANLPGKLAEAKSYAERLFDYRPLGTLGDDTSREALVIPAAAAGVAWDATAVDRTVDGAMGYPYFLQEFGAATWNSAAGPDITLQDAQNGIRLGQAILDGGFFRSRWDRATATERLYLRAMAVDAERMSRTQDVATRMERTHSNLGPIRAGLIVTRPSTGWRRSRSPAWPNSFNGKPTTSGRRPRGVDTSLSRTSELSKTCMGCESPTLAHRPIAD
jgi:hypothetical protein